MFCNQCGKESPDQSKFCGECGSRLEIQVPQQSPVVNEPAEQPKSSWSKVELPKVELPKINMPKIDIPDGPLSCLKTRSVFFFGALIAMLISRFFTLGMHVKMTATLWGFTESESVSMFGDVPALKITSAVLFLIGLALVLLPLATDGKWKKWHQIPAAVVSFVHIVWLLIVQAAGKASAGYYSSMVKVNFTFAGIVFILLNLAIIALLVASMVKDSQNAEKAEQTYTL